MCIVDYFHELWTAEVAASIIVQPLENIYYFDRSEMLYS